MENLKDSYLGPNEIFPSVGKATTKKPRSFRHLPWKRHKEGFPLKTTDRPRPRSQTPLEGMGAVPSSTGTTFRVWAPHADTVAAVGDFNGWQEDTHFLMKEEKGYWALHLNEAKIGDAYKFVIINDGQKLFRSDPYALETDSTGNAVISNPHFQWRQNGFRMADKNALIFYQVHVGTFFGPYDERTGRFSQLCEKMHYLKSLGINAIELVPISDFPGAAAWGYDSAQLFAIERAYGGPKVLADLVDTAHQLGIGVIVKVSFSHFDTSAGGLWQFDGRPENGKGDIYFYNDGRSRNPWGDARPDYSRQEARKYLRDYMFLWLEKYRCDGIHVEASGFVRSIQGGMREGRQPEDGLCLLKEINDEIRTKYPKKLLIADNLQAGGPVTRSITDGGLGFDAQRDDGFMRIIRNVLRQPHDSDRCLSSIAEALEPGKGRNACNRFIYCECHDEIADGFLRLPEEISPKETDGPIARKKAALGAVLLFTAPGIPMLFQGQEFLSRTYFLDHRNPDWQVLSQCRGTTKLFADLIRCRKSCFSSYAGLRGSQIEFIHFNQGDGILAYTRSHQDRPNFKVLVVLNFSNREYGQYSIGVPCKGRWKLVFNSNAKEYEPSNSNLEVRDFEAEERPYGQSPCGGSFALPSYGALLFIKYQTG